MPTTVFRPVPIDTAAATATPDPARWLWHGYLMPGDITLLTSTWKTGKTTLLTGLLRHLGTGEPFLGPAVRPTRAWVVSEEPADLWAERVRQRPIGDHVQLLARPFAGRPTFADWSALVDAAASAGDVGLFVVDPLASFLPGRCESDAATLLEALLPLHRLTATGAAVLLLHHPRKRAAEAGSAARGSGALLGFVDATVELTRYGRTPADDRRRLLTARSRRRGAPDRLAYEWDEATDTFALVPDPRERPFDESWRAVRAVLLAHGGWLTRKEVRQLWPEDVAKPSETAVYNWLSKAHERELVRRDGSGTWRNPWRYRLADLADEYDSDLPPLPDWRR